MGTAPMALRSLFLQRSDQFNYLYLCFLLGLYFWENPTSQSPKARTSPEIVISKNKRWVTSEYSFFFFRFLCRYVHMPTDRACVDIRSESFPASMRAQASNSSGYTWSKHLLPWSLSPALSILFSRRKISVWHFASLREDGLVGRGDRLSHPFKEQRGFNWSKGP